MKLLINILDTVLTYAIRLVCIFLLLIGSYALYDTWTLFDHAQDKSLLAYKPILEGNAEEIEKPENMIAWLTITDTAIDYPIMQGKDNNEYVNKDPYGSYSLSGSIFLDSRNTKDFSDSYNLLYGHHMENDYMFGALDRYEDPGYMDSHSEGTLLVDNKAYDITIFAYLECDASTPEIFDPSEVLLDDTLRYIKSNAKVYREPKSNNILAMSTCKYPESTIRTIVLGAVE